jgi:hypothetical protein
MNPTADDFGFRGFFALRTPADLLRKLEHDFRRLEANRVDSYAAFDFFVTANAMVDWIWPSAGRAQQRDNRTDELLPRLCHHLADGAKHFLLTTRHHGVEETAYRPPAILGQMVLGASRLGDPMGDLVVRLEAEEAEEMNRESIPAVELAALVLDYWKRRLGL